MTWMFFSPVRKAVKGVLGERGSDPYSYDQNSRSAGPLDNKGLLYRWQWPFDEASLLLCTDIFKCENGSFSSRKRVDCCFAPYFQPFRKRPFKDLMPFKSTEAFFCQLSAHSRQYQASYRYRNHAPVLYLYNTVFLC